MTSMLKAVFFVVIGALLWFTGNFLNKYIPYAYEEFKPVEINMQKLKSIKHPNTTRRLDYLNELVEMPLVGRFFRQQKIIELIKLYKFNLSVQQCKKAIQDPLYARSFNVWYHKALSECVLGEFDDCESSLTWASLYADSESEPYVQDIYKILETTQGIRQLNFSKVFENNELVLTGPDFSTKSEEIRQLEEL